MERVDLARQLGATSRASGTRATVVEERDPARFMAGFGAAAAEGGTVFVADPAWGAVEREQFAALTKAEGTALPAAASAGTGWLCLPTGGSSGRLRLARHDQHTLAAAVRGCSRHFQTARINAVGVLPLHHVSGLMAWLRCALTGGRYVPWHWPDLEAGRWPETERGDWFLSLVPTQLQRLLDQRGAAERLRRFRAILLGGGPAWPELIERAAELQLPLAPGYGMTETAAMITALRPEEFLAGRRGCGAALPHGRVTVDAEGVILIAGESLFRGYYPDWRPAGPWPTDDLGALDESGGLRWLGRRDATIITGGKKVEPGEVEAVLRATGQFSDVAVVGLPDVEWGECVAAVYPAKGTPPDIDAVSRSIAGRLAPHKQPKRYLRLARWPRTDQGKLNRRELLALAQAAAGGVRPSDA